MGHFDPGRRRFVARMAGIAAGLSGCTMPDIHLCESSISDLSLPLGIDVHTHVFNGSDLQIHDFFSKIVAEDPDSELGGLAAVLGSIVQELQWNGAPTASDELARLAPLKSIYASCDAAAQPLLEKLRRDAYANGRAQILAARDRARMKSAIAPAVGDAVEPALPASYELWIERRNAVQKSRAAGVPAAVALAGRASLTGALDFILHGFYYRHTNILDYLQAYSTGSHRKIDLMVPHLVDFDWWLANGGATPSRLAMQVAVMERLSILTRGRVHGFVAFCPFREAMTSSNDAPGDSMKLAIDAMGRGFIGVKLYPTMGFAPYGNANSTVWRDHPDGLPAQALDPGFGAALDRALARLYKWCLANGVPIMAHTNHSNGPNSAFEDLAGPDGWADALRAFPGLRVNFGHFGDTDFVADDGAKARAFVELMAMRGGENAYADSAYFADALSDPAALGASIARLFDDPRTAVAARRLMYGTDWEMVLQEPGVDSYLEGFIGLIRPADADAFFGRNAATFLGLAPGGANRARLEAFYARTGVGRPDWMEKIG